MSKLIPHCVFLCPVIRYSLILKIKNKFYKDLYCSTDLIKINSTFLLKPLAALINKSLEEGIFPEKLQLARVIPIYKSGSKDHANNFRPISEFPVFGKYMKK